MAEQIFKDQDVNFAGRPISPLDDCVIFGNDSFIAAPYGHFWRFMKKLSMSELLGTRQIQRSRTVRNQEIVRFLRRMIQSASKNEVVDMGPELMKVTNNIICISVSQNLRINLFVSRNPHDSSNVRKNEPPSPPQCHPLDMEKNFDKVVASISSWEDDNEAKKIQELVKMSCEEVAARYDSLMEKILREHEDKAHELNGNDDLVDVLLRVYHDHTAELRITREQMKSFLAIAGDEIDSVIGTKTRLVEETDIPNLPYIQAIVKETLRLYPNAPFAPRLCLKHSKIDSFDILNNTPVAVNLYSIMRDQTIWENPDEYCPERFLIGSQSSSETQQCFDFVPLGGGRRACPGKNLAFVLMNIVIASVVQCLDLKFIGEEDGVDMRETIGISIVMASPLRCRPVVHFDPFHS
ncbi:hypothetical protein F3Y22_tig00111402pilonHSYRG00077 [Hibiscus syriacus]|uniref:Cytochrome P450 n=1 Tax=Hibiscus syriacus TaxID=106335 RepID=A0A6A2Y946_HIBSY|nr:hypothetical protein F3Y22_tig00111402pilonHSYRG00077 [Hibiscus syriacus]